MPHSVDRNPYYLQYAERVAPKLASRRGKEKGIQIMNVDVSTESALLQVVGKSVDQALARLNLACVSGEARHFALGYLLNAKSAEWSCLQVCRELRDAYGLSGADSWFLLHSFHRSSACWSEAEVSRSWLDVFYRDGGSPDRPQSTAITVTMIQTTLLSDSIHSTGTRASVSRYISQLKEDQDEDAKYPPSYFYRNLC